MQTPLASPANGNVVGKHNFKFQVDVNVINHLGVGLYSSTPAALTELVANAWDADATEVSIIVDSSAKTIVIEDDGHGMSADNIKQRFLNVGYSRRKSSANKEFSDSGARRVMGRKGIGKLAMFALAMEIRISSQASGQEAIGLVVQVPEFKKSLEEKQEHILKEFTPEPFSKGRGTRIELKKVPVGLKTTESYLRVKLARRFSVLGSASNFKVILNGGEITKEDRGFYQYIQFLWMFDKESGDDVQKFAKSIAKLPVKPAPGEVVTPCVKEIPRIVMLEGKEYTVSGFVASVALPKQLGAKEDSANIVSVFANGRVFAEDILPEANSAKYYKNYLVGEIHANFLDDDEIDRATASREAIKKDDPKYQALIKFIRDSLDDIGDTWDEWRTDLGLDETEADNAAVIEWIATLKDGRDRRAASKLMTSIKNSVVHSDEAKNDAAKKILYRGAIIGFEKLRIAGQLDKLVKVTDVLGPEFAAIFASLDQVEEAAYADITRQRLGVITKFAEITNDPSTLEKVAQQYIFDHLWLLDPAWDRITAHAEMEKTLTKELQTKFPDSKGARLDIRYRASSGRHIVVELKRPTLTSLDADELFTQVRKYKLAIESYYQIKEPNKPVPPFDIYLLVAQKPATFDESMRKALAEVNGKLITYTQLINDAKITYQQYLAVNDATGPLSTTLKKLS